MAYKVTYQVQVAWVGPGAGPMQALAGSPGGSPINLPGGGSTGQTKNFAVNPAVLPVSNTFLSADITNLTNSMAADMVTQFTAAITQIQNFSTGTP